MEFNENQARRPVFSLRSIYRYFRRKSLNRKTVRILRELSPEQLRDIGLSKHDLSYWD
ncbi:DUF1127 domain-containing protein [Klebsiella sp. BIGb0407]|uniref:DUF1127 domain-containing protein n=1 Tax=Klebsiella sp. BIGb0407 TaxID=2940603 RepID=UPI00216A06E7|nr:DUF1127 domain-containing protein [Klebsiella sp. BIGb0407]MCS3432782.1 uncharacterized protein YjiS (DUF1127 family) [Klebsiella sp. BIGb0407]